MMNTHSTRELFALWCEEHGFVGLKGSYNRKSPDLAFIKKEDAEIYSKNRFTICRIQVTCYDCDHSTQFAYKIAHGKNAGKWVAVCAHCGSKSRGRPKSTEAIAHASLTQHPSVGATKAFIVGYEA